jgi:hypothetical protein
MANKTKYFRSKKPIPIGLQAALLKQMFHDSRVVSISGSSLRWEGDMLPSALSERYKVRMDYQLSKRPEVRVLSPELRSLDRRRPPHLFAEGTLCLFRYKYEEWDSSMPLAETVIPWTSLWLFHYETWLATGRWPGSNQEHPAENREKGKKD